MEIKQFTIKLHEIINYTDRIDIASLTKDYVTEQRLFVELSDGSKFEIIVLPTDRII